MINPTAHSFFLVIFTIMRTWNLSCRKASRLWTKDVDYCLFFTFAIFKYFFKKNGHKSFKEEDLSAFKTSANSPLLIREWSDSKNCENVLFWNELTKMLIHSWLKFISAPNEKQVLWVFLPAHSVFDLWALKPTSLLHREYPFASEVTKRHSPVYCVLGRPSVSGVGSWTVDNVYSLIFPPFAW